MVKLSSLVSRMDVLDRLVTRTLAWVVDDPVTLQGSLPSLVVLLKRVVQVEPPSLERSMRTLPATPVDVQRMV